MTTIKDLLKLAFAAGRLSGHRMASNVVSDNKKEVPTFEELLESKYLGDFDIEAEVNLKANDNT